MRDLWWAPNTLSFIAFRGRSPDSLSSAPWRAFLQNPVPPQVSPWYLPLARLAIGLEYRPPPTRRPQPRCTPAYEFGMGKGHIQFSRYPSHAPVPAWGQAICMLITGWPRPILYTVQLLLSPQTSRRVQRDSRGQTRPFYSHWEAALN